MKCCRAFSNSSSNFKCSAAPEDYQLNIHHLKIQTPFSYRHGDSTFEQYTEVQDLGTVVIHDPDGFIRWEDGQDIQGKMVELDTCQIPFSQFLQTSRDFSF